MIINQISHATTYNRHPELFRECSEIIGDKKKNKILSFGCSYGHEVFTLKNLYFKNSLIDGFDISPEIISAIENENKELRFFSSLDYIFYEYYDVIFCMSVLTRNPDEDKQYSFQLFENTLKIIDKYLKIGGYLCIWNSRFRFSETNVFLRYKIIETNYKNSGTTIKFDKQYENELTEEYPFILFQKTK